jgi:hypothetical protein
MDSSKFTKLSVTKAAIRIIGCILAALFLPDTITAITILGLTIILADLVGLGRDLI